jgi:hypothetical protein
MNIWSIFRKLAGEENLTLAEIEHIHSFDWHRFRAATDSRIAFEDWFECDHYDMMFPGYMLGSDDILEWSRRHEAISTLAIEETDEFVWIEDCDQYAHARDRGNSWDYWGHTAYSEGWMNENTFVCDNCGERFDNDDYAEGGYCRECYYSGDNSENADLYPYNARIQHAYANPYFYNNIWHREPGKALIYGLELETETDGSLYELAEKLNEIRHDHKFIIKSDGSLNCGLELITSPMDLDGHKRVFDWPQVARLMRNNGAESESTCGIHIHINKAAISELTLTKLTAFLCKGDHKRFNQAIAQRRYYSNGYCNVDNHVSSLETKLTKIKSDIERAGRYVAVNTDTGHGTYEIRIFAANLRSERVLKNLEFVDALIHYCQESSIQNLSPDSFIAWVANHRPTYRNLWGFMVEKSLVDPAAFKKECHGHGQQLQRAA